MSASDVKARLLAKAAPVEAYLADLFGETPSVLAAPMRHALLAGGKRLRPVLHLTAAALCGADPAPMLPFAAGLECIHSYSLAHDDLPAMDNDALRRGKPSCWKAFGEAAAILAGDGLLTDAFALMASISPPLPAERTLAALAEVAKAAGSVGMVGGQALDMGAQGAAQSFEALKDMHARKTGALLTASLVSGALLGCATESALAAVRAYGTAFGLAFQITDDVLDCVGDEAVLGKPVGSDEAKAKSTYVSAFGLDGAREQARLQVEAAKTALALFSGDEAAFLADLADYLLERAQ